MIIQRFINTLHIITLTLAAFTRAAIINQTLVDDFSNKSVINYAWQGDHGWSCNKASANAGAVELVPLVGRCDSTNQNKYRGKTHAWMGGENTCVTRMSVNGAPMDPITRGTALVVCAGANVDGEEDKTIVIEWWPHHDCDSYGFGGGPDGPYTVEVATNSGVCIDPMSAKDHTGKPNNNIYSIKWHYK